MKAQDYLIAQEGHDWGALLAPWRDLLPSQFEVWLVNRIADVILVDSDGAVHFLDVGVGSITRLAGSKDEFGNLIDRDGNADDWLALDLVDRLVGAGVTLEPGQCYGFVQPPVLGGEWAPENVRPLPVAEVYGTAGSIYTRIKDLPDGAEVRFDTSD